MSLPLIFSFPFLFFVLPLSSYFANVYKTCPVITGLLSLESTFHTPSKVYSLGSSDVSGETKHHNGVISHTGGCVVFKKRQGLQRKRNLIGLVCGFASLREIQAGSLFAASCQNEVLSLFFIRFPLYTCSIQNI